MIEKSLDSYEEKPWLENNRSNLSDYFNYGFDENTWKYYQQIVMKRADQLEKLKETDEIKRRFKERNINNHPYLNFCLPHDFGGLGDPLEQCYS